MVFILLCLRLHDSKLLLKNVFASFSELDWQHIRGPQEHDSLLMFAGPGLRFFNHTLLRECLFDILLPSYRCLLVFMDKSIDMALELLLIHFLVGPSLMALNHLVMLQRLFDLLKFNLGVPLLSMLFLHGLFDVQNPIFHTRHD